MRLTSHELETLRAATAFLRSRHLPIIADTVEEVTNQLLAEARAEPVPCPECGAPAHLLAAGPCRLHELNEAIARQYPLTLAQAREIVDHVRATDPGVHQWAEALPDEVP